MSQAAALQVVGASGVHQQRRMSGRRGIEYDERLRSSLGVSQAAAMWLADGGALRNHADSGTSKAP